MWLKWYSQCRTQTTNNMTFKSTCRKWVLLSFLLVKTHAASILMFKNTIGKLCRFLKVFYCLRKSHEQWFRARSCTFLFCNINGHNPRCHLARAALFLWFSFCVHKALGPIQSCCKGPYWRPWWGRSRQAAPKRQAIFLMIWCYIWISV